MKIVLTGSLGNIGKPLVHALVKQGHDVKVISSKEEKQKDIDALGATAAIGTMQDVDFLTQTFAGADVVYLMVALGHQLFFDKQLDYRAATHEIVSNYKQALQRSGVKKVIYLSTVGAHLAEGNGLLAFHYHGETLLKTLPDSVSIKFIRPVGFYENLLRFIPVIKSQGVIRFNYDGDIKHPWVSPADIAKTIAEEMGEPFVGRTIRYVVSAEYSPNQIANTLGNAIGKPDLKWIVVTDDELLKGMLAAGMNEQIAKGLVEMQASQRSGLLYEDFVRHKPDFGNVKLNDFAKVFATIYQQQ